MNTNTTAPTGVVSSTELGAGDVVWVRHNGKPHTSGVAHFGGECPPGWVGGARPFFSVDYLTKAVEKYAAVCSGVAREECRGEKANPDYKAREAARAAYIKAIKDAEERIRATLIVEDEKPEKLRETIAQRIADLGKHHAPNSNLSDPCKL